MALRRGARLVGTFLLIAGALILLFVAYQLWGTSVTTRLHQEQLRRQFDQELAQAHHPKTAHSSTTSIPSSSSTTTQPISGVTYPVPGDVPAEGQPIGIIDIPAIGANFVVVEGTSTSDLMLGPGHYAGTPLPGQPGNAAIAGHRTTYLHPFYSLDQVAAGDPIYVTTTQGRFEYRVTDVTVVPPTDVAVLDPTPTPTLTLTTCNPRYSASQRLVVLADLVSPPAPVPIHKPISSHLRKPTAATAGRLAGTGGSTWGAVGWAAGCLGVAATIWALRRRRPRVALAAGLYFVGTLVLLVLLFFFFQSISPLLPASF
jgi:sortase A